MKDVYLYLSGMMPYLFIFFPIYLIIRVYYIYIIKKNKYKLTYEITLGIFVLCIIGMISQTIIPEFEMINGKIGLVSATSNLSLQPFKLLTKMFNNGIRYNNMSYFFISVIGNIAMFIPVGLFLPLLSAKYTSAFKTIFTGFCISLFIELFQLILPRVTDIDDLILNTAGTALGFGIYMIIRKLYPKLLSYTRKDFLINI